MKAAGYWLRRTSAPNSGRFVFEALVGVGTDQQCRPVFKPGQLNRCKAPLWNHALKVALVQPKPEQPTNVRKGFGDNINSLATLLNFGLSVMAHNATCVSSSKFKSVSTREKFGYIVVVDIY